ncbi:glycosyltransferase [Parvularcula maris]|uniref:Glycosyltransferase n=1 Tax=Parvularcula maris TaxID=2965077 RepID=A0A9X2L9D8_9PROT|nr:glycosyltransferase [Parvularcula maris]MCQ8185381.1 glycosyltransferase [Parvularcula maris]
MQVCFYPAFENSDKLTDHFYRLHWYLAPFAEKIASIVLPVVTDAVTVGEVPTYLDEQLRLLNGTLPVRQMELSTSDLEQELERADLVLLWRTDDASANGIPTELKGKSVIRVDHDNVQNAGSFYLKFAEWFPDRQQESLERSKTALDTISRELTSSKGYIFGTGPGLGLMSDHDFSDGVAIACNSMVRNKPLLQRMKPPLVVVGDPIFHAGPSSYAAAFRASLVEVLDEYSAYLMVPMRDFHIYEYHLPERFITKIIGMPFKKGEEPQLDLLSNHVVTTTSNILTLFLLPLATTFFDEIAIAGCDGRPVSSDDYFWSHDTASQFNDQMPVIRQAHPAFFAIDYNDYYLRHCETLETWLSAAEEKGHRIVNMTPSFISALQKRSVPSVKNPSENELDNQARPLVSIIVPAFNAEQFLQQMVLSIRHQDMSSWELVIVNNNSTDTTEDLALEWSGRDPRIRVVSEPAAGVSHARNRGLAEATGRFITFLDADDEMDRGSLRARAQKLLDNPDIELVHSRLRRTDEYGRSLGLHNGAGRDITFKDMYGNAAQITTLMGRAELMSQFRFPTNLANGEDWMYLAEILRTGVKSYYVPEGTCTYRVHSASNTYQSILRHEKNLIPAIDYVYSRDGRPQIADEFREGLNEPPRDQILYGRLEGPLIWSILGRSETDFDTIMAEQAFVDYMRKKSVAACAHLVERIAVRIFRIPTTDIKLSAKIDREEIAAFMRQANLGGRLPQLAEAVEQTLYITPSLDEVDLPRTRQLRKLSEGRRMLIIGNGPSTRELAAIGFDRLPADMDTFGMGIAYRYFSRINWWPTYYACADSKVVHSHRDRLKTIIESEQVSTRQFFFSRPLTDHPRLTEIPHSSTGDFCFEKAVELGYKHIYLIGVEGSYVEEIAESRPLTESEFKELGYEDINLAPNLRKLLIIENSPNFNPNYFFDDYQRKGDVYSLPQAKGHRYAWKEKAKAAKVAEVSVFNLSPHSLITQFPKMRLQSLLDMKPSNWSSSQENYALTPAVQDPKPKVRPAAVVQTKPPTASAPVPEQKVASGEEKRSQAGAPEKRPFYAPFGDWLQKRSPRSFGLLRLGRKGLAGGWRRRTWVVPAIVLALLPALVGAFALERVGPVPTSWGAPLIGLSVLLVFCFGLFYLALRTYVGLSALTGEAVAGRARMDDVLARLQDLTNRQEQQLAYRRESERTFSKLTKRIDQVEKFAREVHQSAEEKIARLDQQICSDRERINGVETRLSSVDQVLRQQLAKVKKLAEESTALSKELSDAAQQVAEATAQALSSNTIARRVEEAANALSQAQANHDSKIDTLQKASEEAIKEFRKFQTTSIGTDLAVVARSLRPMWLGGSGLDRREFEVEKEHGHILLMDALIDLERRSPGTLSGRSLIEIGMTRELWQGQRSTQKLSLFAALLDLHYIGVDMDTKNVAAAKDILPYLNPAAQVFVSKGEDFLKLHTGSIDFVYLDAYDFDHGKHSDQRQDSYERNLGARISDEDCWKMHLSCAKTLTKRLAPDGIVALDDTWVDLDGAYHGKGKLAVPYMLDNSFQIIAQTEMTVCLSRSQQYESDTKPA